MKRNIISILILSCFIATSAIAQSGMGAYADLPKIIPTSPNAASLGKFGEIPVGYYTGIPNISIPIYTVKAGDIEIPVSLDYHAGGIKVEEMASWVGTGWALNAGGVITRSQRGLIDELAEGFIYQGRRADSCSSNLMTTNRKNRYMFEIFHSLNDGESDIYNFNVGGLSGKFFFSNDGQVIVSPRSDIKVEFIAIGPKWKITDSKGIQYYFNITEFTTATPFCGGTNISTTSGDYSYSITAWNLSKIEDVNGNEIDISYQGGGGSFQTKIAETRNVSNAGDPEACLPETTFCYNETSVSGYSPGEITFPGGKVVFVQQPANREDVTSKALDRIFVLNSAGDTIKSFKFYTSYFNLSNVGGCQDGVFKRLRLIRCWCSTLRGHQQPTSSNFKQGKQVMESEFLTTYFCNNLKAWNMPGVIRNTLPLHVLSGSL